MNVNNQLAVFSDTAFESAFFIYAIALVFSLIYYAKSRSLIDAEREFKQASAEKKVPAHVESAESGAAATDSEELSVTDMANLQIEIAEKEKSANKFGGMTQSLVWLGIIVHAVAAVTRGISAGRFPFGNLYEYVLVVTLFCMVIAAFVLQKKSLRIMWTWVLLPILALMFYGGTKLYVDSAPVVPALKSVWLPIHVATVSTGAAIGLISGLASIMYLLRMHEPQGKEKGILGAIATPLPSAKTLDSIAYRSAIVTVPVLGLGIVLGAIWAESAWGRPWGWDPKETVSFISWILYAAYLHARATAGWRDSRAAWINILAFATMVFNLFFINMVVSGLHSYAGLN